ncbi:MAG: SAF domain-containing protein [Actinomycetota bacterium]|nr:SAF domain-containing protein [Actinomycetota bacterium]
MGTSGTAAAAQIPPGAPAGSPTPRRLRAPRWLNFRLIAGILLVLVSVVAGARILTAADASDVVWAAESDLAAGTILADGDLRAVPVSLAEAGPAYMLSSTDPVGRALRSPISTGELLPRSALAETSTLVDIALPIAAGFVPPNLQRGQLVDVYAIDATPTATAPSVPDRPEPGTQTPAPPSSPSSGIVTMVAEAVVVQLIAGRSDGALSIASSTIQVVISVEAEQAPDVFAAIAGKELAVAVRSSLSRPTQATERPAGTRTPDPAPPTTPTQTP